MEDYIKINNIENKSDFYYNLANVYVQIIVVLSNSKYSNIPYVQIAKDK